MLKFLLIFFMIFPTVSMANTFSCKSNIPVYNIKVSENPIVYNYNLFSSQIPVDKNPEFLALGLFKPSWSINVKSKMTGLRSSTEKCLSISNIEVNVVFNPVIYIAKESQKYQCTYNRVMKHEYTHYMIAHRAFNILIKNMNVLLKEYFDNSPMSYNDQINLNLYISNQTQLLTERMHQIMDNNSLQYQNQLDTQENYEKESHQCSNAENVMLSTK